MMNITKHVTVVQVTETRSPRSLLLLHLRFHIDTEVKDTPLFATERGLDSQYFRVEWQVVDRNLRNQTRSLDLLVAPPIPRD
jgi:hypothetical protein